MFFLLIGLNLRLGSRDRHRSCYLSFFREVSSSYSVVCQLCQLADSSHQASSRMSRRSWRSVSYSFARDWLFKVLYTLLSADRRADRSWTVDQRSYEISSHTWPMSSPSSTQLRKVRNTSRISSHSMSSRRTRCIQSTMAISSSLGNALHYDPDWVQAKMFEFTPLSGWA